jgi:hypothetical protein
MSPWPVTTGVAPRPVLLHVEVRRAVAHEGIELGEGARVQQLLDALARGELALGVLLLLGLGGRVGGQQPQLLELGELLLEGLRDVWRWLIGRGV